MRTAEAILGLLTVALLRNQAAQLGITEITQRNNTLYFYIEHPTQEQITSTCLSISGENCVQWDAEAVYWSTDGTETIAFGADAGSAFYYVYKRNKKQNNALV